MPEKQFIPFFAIIAAVIPAFIGSWITAALVVIPLQCTGLSASKGDRLIVLLTWLLTIGIVLAVAVVAIELTEQLCFVEDGLQGVIRHVFVLFDKRYCL